MTREQAIDDAVRGWARWAFGTHSPRAIKAYVACHSAAGSLIGERDIERIRAEFSHRVFRRKLMADNVR